MMSFRKLEKEEFIFRQVAGSSDNILDVIFKVSGPCSSVNISDFDQVFSQWMKAVC